MRRRCSIAVLLAVTMGLVISAMAQEHSPNVSSSSPSATESRSTPAAEPGATHGSASPKAASGKATEASLRLEGEKRFRANCGRCHQPPHKFPPRVMATAIRHMRVRAMITDEDMRLILRYMTD
jgi:mono/diheme cytochrome c family protein